MTFFVVLLAVLFGLSSLGQFASVDLNGIRIYLVDLFAAGFAFSGLVYLLAVKKSFKLPKYLYFYFLFVMYALFTLIVGLRMFTFSETLVSGLYLARICVYFLVSLVIYNLRLLDKNFSPKVVAIMVLSVLFVALVGFVQIKFFPNLADLSPELGWDPHIFRMTSTFFDPNFVGGYLVLGLALLFSKAFDEKDKSKRNFYLALISILIAALILTFSRSSWLMFSVVVLLYGLLRNKKLIFVTLAIMFCAYYFVPRIQTRLAGVTDPADSARLRLVSWDKAWQIAKDSIFVGVGFNTFRYAQETYGFIDFRDESRGGHAGAGSDSSLLLVLADTGILGFVLFLLYYMDLFLNGFKYALREKGWLPVVLISSIAGLMVHCVFVNSLFYPQYLLWIAALSGVSYLTLFEFDLDG